MLMHMPSQLRFENVLTWMHAGGSDQMSRLHYDMNGVVLTQVHACMGMAYACAWACAYAWPRCPHTGACLQTLCVRAHAVCVRACCAWVRMLCACEGTGKGTGVGAGVGTDRDEGEDPFLIRARAGTRARTPS